MAYPARRLLTLVLVTEGAALAVALFLGWRLGIQFFPITQDFWGDVTRGALGALPPLVLFVCLLSRRAGRFALLRPLRRKVLGDIRVIFLDAGVTELVLISALAGFAEELLFRGVLQTKVGIVAASIIFGLAHFVSLSYVIAASIMGFYIGAAYQMSGHLLMPIQLHFIYDLGALIYIRYFAAAGDP